MIYARIACAFASATTASILLTTSFGCEIRTSTPSSQENTRRETHRAQEPELDRQAQARAREDARARQRLEAAEEAAQGTRDDERALILQQQRAERVEQKRREAEKAASDAETLRAGCLADRPARERARKDAQVQAAKDEAKRKKAEERAAYFKKSCKPRSRALSGPTDEICENDDGTLRRCVGVYGVEYVFDCPANGPVGLRGTIVAGQTVEGQQGRIAWASGPRRPTRDEICAAPDAAAITSSPAALP